MTNIFLKLAALSLAKKVAGYVLARSYGFPRLYRRAMEANRWVFPNPTSRARATVRHTAQFTLRLPRKVMEALRRKTRGLEGTPGAATTGSTPVTPTTGTTPVTPTTGTTPVTPTTGTTPPKSSQSSAAPTDKGVVHAAAVAAAVDGLGTPKPPSSSHTNTPEERFFSEQMEAKPLDIITDDVSVGSEPTETPTHNTDISNNSSNNISSNSSSNISSVVSPTPEDGNIFIDHVDQTEQTGEQTGEQEARPS